MVEISKSSCDDFSTNERFSGDYGMSDSGNHVCKLFTRYKNDNEEHNVPQEETAIISVELASFLSQHNLPRMELNTSRSIADGLRCKDATDSRMGFIESDSSREYLCTPPEVASASTLPLTSPQRKLQEFAEELAKIKAERTKHRTALSKQVLNGIDIPASVDSESPCSSKLVPKNPVTVSEYDDPYSVSSRSSEENLFQDATDELHDEEESTQEQFGEKRKTTNSESMDFSFLHSVYRGKGEHKEAILLRMKYAGNKGARKERSNDTATDTASSDSILGSVPPPETEAEFKEYADFFREIRKCTTQHRFHQVSSTTGMGSASASGSTTPRQQCKYSSKGSSVLTSNKTSKTSFEAGPSTATPRRVMSLPLTQPGSPLVSERSSPLVSRSASPPSKTSDFSSRPHMSAGLPRPFNDFAESPLLSHQADFQKNPISESTSIYHEYPPSESSQLSNYPQYPTSESPMNSGYHEYPLSESPWISSYHEYPTSESPRHSTYHEYPTSKSPLRSTHECATLRSPISSSHNSSLHNYVSESLSPHNQHEHPTSESGTEDDWPFRTDRSDRSTRKKQLEIPITIDGRVVYPELVFAEDTRAAQTHGPLGLLDRVKSFAQCCGPSTTDKEPPPVLQPFPEGCHEEGKTSAKLNTALLSRLTCVECGSLCTPPVAMCVWGHIICEECRPVSLWESHGRCWCRKRCPHCSGDMMSQPCELWSNIARSLLYPCRFAKNGCRQTQGLTPDDKLLHEQACLWRQLRCWYPGCSWRGGWHQLRAHVVRSHLRNATQADWYRFVTVCGAQQIGRSSDVIALPAKELVLLHSLAVIGEHRYLLQYLNEDGGGGAVMLVPRFRLRVTSRDGKSEIEVRGEAVPCQHNVERALRNGKCFRLSGTPFGGTEEPISPEDVTVQLCLEKGRLSVS